MLLQKLSVDLCLSEFSVHNSPRELVKNRASGPVGLGWGLWFCISD